MNWIQVRPVAADCGMIEKARGERGGRTSQMFVGMPPRDEAKKLGGAVRVRVVTLRRGAACEGVDRRAR